MGTRMWCKLLRSFLLAYWVVEVFSTPVLSQKVPIEKQAYLYENKVYDYSVEVPVDLKYERSVPPNPDHGIRISVNADSFIWVDASYTETLNVHKIMKQEVGSCKVSDKKKEDLGGIPGTRVTFSCKGVSGQQGYNRTIIFVAKERTGYSPTIYLVGLQARDHRTLNANLPIFTNIVKAFHFKNK